MYDTKSVQTTTTSEPRSLRLAEQPMSMCGQAGIAHPMRCRDEQQKKVMRHHQTANPSRSYETASLATKCAPSAETKGKYEGHG